MILHVVSTSAIAAAISLSCFARRKTLVSHLVFRTGVDRCAGDGEHTVADEMAEERCKGLHKVEVLDRHGKVSEAIVELRYRRILVRPPRAKQRDGH